ncbi:hypothetical protein CEUSTIGMA_g4406.t1 [Chlamydomonas eustigma]|uniref:Glycosyltransferase 2-like domain-containing protein n=1 Tax=Chlamydomonas eustigma TaxID=1157962 RepID=A0A250X1Z6_9CHLO|nr:hypothetical protein CEUSTIGMA_g4406.t1 [Chlamydomonas eustigma]|eukprot:GAX76959.1 hypothetical protein CEUSTIGMA_g4406.t1 [Chlamydomonas eustigma]
MKNVMNETRPAVGCRKLSRMSNKLPLKLCVVIPALNEEQNIARAINSCRDELVHRGDVLLEVVVADGGSSDQTREVARSLGAKVITCARGRGVQLNAGWRASEMAANFSQSSSQSSNTNKDICSSFNNSMKSTSCHHRPYRRPYLAAEASVGASDVKPLCENGRENSRRSYVVINHDDLECSTTRQAAKAASWWSSLFSKLNTSDKERGQGTADPMPQHNYNGPAGCSTGVMDCGPMHYNSESTEMKYHSLASNLTTTACSWFLFLHADSQLPPGYSSLLRDAVMCSQLPPGYSSSLRDAVTYSQQLLTVPQDREAIAVIAAKDECSVTDAENAKCRAHQAPASQSHFPASQSHLQLWQPSAVVGRWGCFKTIQAAEFKDTLQGKLLSFGVELRTRLLHKPYGDQALFVQKQTLEKEGGFKEWPFLEDVELVTRLSKVSRPIIIDAPVITSGRRWSKLGFWKTCCLNQAILLGYSLGIDVHTLAKWYGYVR